MSADFKKVLVKDDRLAVTDSVNYAVMKGGQNITTARYNAISQTNSSHTYTVIVPSEQTICDRRVIWNSTVCLQLTGIPSAGKFLIDYGRNDALSAFPLHQLTSTITATINNNTVSINMRDVLPAILRFNDKRELARYNGMTPTAFDTYKYYADALDANNNPLGSFVNVADNDLVPRGAFDVIIVSALDANGVPTGALVAGDGVAQRTAYIQFTVSEPLLLSPFIFGNPQSNNQGFYGIQNMNFVMNIGDASRVWRHGSSWAVNASVYSFTNSRLIFQFLTPHPDDLMPARNVVPYYELPRYLSTGFSSLSASNTATLSSNSIQLNQIPDKLIIFARKPMSQQTNTDTDSFLTINQISINFNNNAGILSTSTPYDLYRFSVEAGSNQSWLEFSGKCKAHDQLTGKGKDVYTSGSLLVLDMARHLQLTESFYAPGSLGNFNIQFNVNVTNNSNDAVTPELVLITMNSGVFICERGTSQTYTGILTKQDVMETSQQEPYKRSDVMRMMGGGFLDTLKSLASSLLPKLPSVAKSVLSNVPHPMAQAVSSGLGAMGYGASGGKKGKLANHLM